MRDAPYLEGELLGQYRIFLEVDKNRRYTPGGPLPLHAGAFNDYFDLYEVPRAERSEIVDFVSAIDAVWMAEHFAAARVEAATKKT